MIGASWAAYYLARGFNVVATDPGPNAEAALRRYVDDAWSTLTRAGLSPGASRDHLSAALCNRAAEIARVAHRVLDVGFDTADVNVGAMSTLRLLRSSAHPHPSGCEDSLPPSELSAAPTAGG